MKIGIVTLPLHINYGGYLQNYALQVVLRRLGHEPITLNQRPRKKPFVEILHSIVLPNVKTLALAVVGRKGTRPFMRIHRKNLRNVLWQNSLFFYDKYINHTAPLNPNKDFKGICEKYNLAALIVGSDQVWRPRYVEDLEVNYLSFAKGNRVKKLSYAASFGTDKWEYSDEQTSVCKILIDEFSLVTVREKSAVSLCKKYYGQEAYQVLDPTLLLDKEDYIELISAEKEPVSQGNLFCYILDESPQKNAFVDKVSFNTGLRPFYVNIGKSPTEHSVSYIKSHIELFVNPSITKWLRGFMDAEMVIADSFHSVAFSIIFNKPFWVIGNKTRGMSRFISILEMFHLENRLLDENCLNDSLKWDSPIDWEEVNSIRCELKKQSFNILRKGLTI